MRFLFTILFLFWSAVSWADTVSEISLLLTPKSAKKMGISGISRVFAVDGNGAVVVGTADNLRELGGGRAIFANPVKVSDCVFTPDGALLAVSGNWLGYCAQGSFHPCLKLPDTGMRIAPGASKIYIFGGDGGSCAIYIVDPKYGYLKLCVMPQPVKSADTSGDTLFFGVANDVYRLTPGGELNLICRIPGPEIESVAAVAKDTVYFLAGRSLYCWRKDSISIVGADLGTAVRWQAGTLYIFDPERRSLMRVKLNDRGENGK